MTGTALSRPRFPWRVALLLTLGCVAGTLAILPQMLAMAGDQAPPLAQAMPLAALQSAVMLGLATLVGLALAERLGRRPVLIEELAHGRVQARAWPVLRDALLVGFMGGAAVGVLQATVVLPLMPAPLQAVAAQPLWSRLLGGMLYGGIVEEVLLRLLLVSALVLVMGRSRWAWRVSILAAALAFGALHLPVVMAFGAPSADLVAWIVGLNATLGVAFGYLYMHRGIEAAMLAHAAAHVPLQVMVSLVG